MVDKLKMANTVKRSDYSTFFKKQDPPQFKGDCLDYVEWKKQWLSQVSSHSPPSEFELDLIKRNLPDDGRKKLYGCDSIATAWLLLDKMYGDKKLIVQKLKSKLKNLTPKSIEAHEIVIELSDEVEYLVKRLRLLGATEVLTIDNDFLNSIYKHLPEFHRQKWDDFDISDYPSEWSAFMDFCHDIYTKAIAKRTRMESIKEMDRNNMHTLVPTKIGIVTSDNSSLVSHGSVAALHMDDKFSAKSDKFGDCKVCHSRHYFENKFTKKIQPSDKFLNCESFKSLNKAERGKVIECHKACRRCLSWSHDVSSCTMKVISYKERNNGSECGKDHSRLICGSGVIYCLSLRSSDDKLDECIPSFPQMDDAVIRNGTARIVYDGGSQRVLINDDFAKEQGLQSTDVTVNLELASNKVETLKTKRYQIELYDNSGKAHLIWGYGCPKIMSPYESVNLKKVRHLFKELPDDAFQSIPEKRIDILLGLNFFGLHPHGGSVVAGNLVAEKSMFNKSGWCIGGSHPLLGISSAPQFTPSANILKWLK